MHPLLWHELPSIHDVPLIDETDNRCLNEIKEVLQKHGKTGRFGVALLHRHFHLADDELVVECCDHETRTLTSTPQKAAEVIERGYIPTLWQFDGTHPRACSYCPTHGNQHDGYKENH